MHRLRPAILVYTRKRWGLAGVGAEQGTRPEDAGPMMERNVWIPPRLSAGEERLKEELSHALVNPLAAAELRGYLEDCFRRLLTTLEFVPEGAGRVLELGANPYFFTMLLKRLRHYELELANFFGGRGENEQTVRNSQTGETHEFRYR